MTLKRVFITAAGTLVLAAAVMTAAASATATIPASTAGAAACTNGVSDRIGGRVVCIHAGGKCVAAHNARYRARGFACIKGRLRRIAKPAISIADASGAEGSTGSSTLSVPVTLSAASTSTVTVGYATADGTATAGSDYSAANGTLTFRPGETEKTIPISIAADTRIEPDETFTVTLSSPVNAKIARGAATVTITNDDTATAVTPGSYKGQTQNGSFVFFTVTPDRTITAMRFNDLPESCDPNDIRIPGGSDFGPSTFHIDAAGRFSANGEWSGSDPQGDVEWTNWSANVVGSFSNPTSVNGTITEKYELNYKGRHYKCSSGQITWSATRQG